MTSNPLLELTGDDFLAVLGGLSDVVALSNAQGRVMWVSRSLCESLNISQEEWLGKTTRELIKEGHLARSLANIKTDEAQTGIILTKNGKEFMSIVRPIYDKEHNIKFYLSTSTLLEELNELKYQLGKLSRQNKRYHGEIQLLRELLFIANEMVFESIEMKSLIDYVIKIAPFDTTVLITGESGVGKEVLAKALHLNSRRKNGPFIPVTIPSIPANLLEAELFGYSDGSFTGAARGGKVGLIELSHGGTLFLDEIGDCPYDTQVKILRTLETNEIRRVGDAKTTKLDIRIVAATNKNLAQMVEKGLFREDLFYRLNVLPLHIKPLRERPQDIEPLCEFFIDKLNNRYNLRKQMSRIALEKLINYTWPGNIRELRNVIERLVILSEDDWISIEDVNAILGHLIDDVPVNMKQNQSMYESTWHKYESYEQSKILEVLKQVGGNKSKAARILGISRTKLYQKLRNN
jgi:transcriptional regulator with PAS, ATPase and Fis domain